MAITKNIGKNTTGDNNKYRDWETLSQPTLGPLFGSFKLQHFMFFGGFRLYNSWLHNNRTGIGMKMSDIKLPTMLAKTYGTATDAKTNISASALYKYL